MAEDLISGMAEAPMSRAMRIDAMGSKTVEEVYLTISVDKTTEREPRASARMCKKMPWRLSL